MRTGGEYREALRDGRRVWVMGEGWVEDVTTHPATRAMVELGKAIKTIFLCQYLHEEALRHEINDGLQVVENWNSANGFIFFGKGGEIANNRFED